MNDTVTDAQVLRSYVARWLALRSEHADESVGVVMVPREKSARVFALLAEDALGSERLLCLLERARPSRWRDFRVAVFDWLRACAELAPASGVLPESVIAREAQPGLFDQLAADAMHSGLLLRLFCGEEPLPFEEWKSRGAGWVGPAS